MIILSWRLFLRPLLLGERLEEVVLVVFSQKLASVTSASLALAPQLVCMLAIVLLLEVFVVVGHWNKQLVLTAMPETLWRLWLRTVLESVSFTYHLNLTNLLIINLITQTNS